MELSTRARFAIGVIAALGIAMGLNLLPYWRTYGANQTDGFEDIGFPMVFRRFGGFMPHYESSLTALLVDVTIAVVIAVAAGFGAMKFMPMLSRPEGRGFPVRPKRQQTENDQTPM